MFYIIIYSVLQSNLHGGYYPLVTQRKEALNSKSKNSPSVLFLGRRESIHPEFKGIGFSVHFIWMISSTIFNSTLYLMPLKICISAWTYPLTSGPLCLLNMGTWLSHRHLTSACVKLKLSYHLPNIYLFIYSFCCVPALLPPPALGGFNPLCSQWLRAIQTPHCSRYSGWYSHKENEAPF